MNIEKLKEHECRFCKHYADEICCELPDEACAFQWFKDQSRPKDKPILWELHPDIAEAMPETTELTEVSFRNVRLNKMVTAYFETACCKVSPIYNENYCPSCGRRIAR